MPDSPGTDATLTPGGRTSTRPGAEPQELQRGMVVGRYVVLGRVGAGGMGIVYAAFDPELDRKVALKVLHRSGASERDSGGKQALLREAQAMAKLSHPNVVAVHDVGEHEGQIYLAMEFVDGITLGAWQQEQPRRWPEIVDAFIAAGQGLAAAHARGLVHRDFKPDNVLVGDGRVRVADFGLAVRIAPAARMKTALDQGTTSSANDQRVAGTPAYMAPEQYLDQHVGPAADQFAFCVALWEALYGERPFGGTSLVELAANVTTGVRRPPPPNSCLPAWLRRVCERGLATDPSQRFASMNDLIAALQRGRAPARWRRIAAGSVVLALTGPAILGWRAYDRSQAMAACEAEGAAIEDIWNDRRQVALSAALMSTGLVFAEVTANEVLPRLDEQAHAWSEARAQACVAANVDATWDADTSDRAQWCLELRRMELDALVTALETGEDAVVQQAVTAASGLARVDVCLHVDVLARMSAPPEPNRADAQAVYAELSRAAALGATGAFAEGRAVSEAALEQATAVGWPPLVAAARLHVAMMLEGQGDYAQAETWFEDAYFESSDAGATEVALDASLRLVNVVGNNLKRPRDGKRWARQVDVLRRALPDPTRLREGDAANALGLVHWAAGEYERARELHREALAVREEALGVNHPRVAHSLEHLAIAELELGHHEEALRLQERALRIREETHGSSHPAVASTLNNLGNVYEKMNAIDRARESYGRCSAAGRDRPAGP